MESETIVAVATLVTASAAAIVSIVNVRRADKAAALAAKTAASAEASQKAIIATRDGVFEVGKRIDGRLSELLEVTAASSYAEGKLAGRKQKP